LKLGLTEQLGFAIQLCLEEAVSNVIRHSYAGDDGKWVTVRCNPHQNGQVVFTIEDEAAPFDPLQGAEPAAIGPQDDGRLGGQGIRLLREFADTLAYESSPGCNRLHVGFYNAASPVSDQDAVR
jgi:serine/threonine-protein kinase RsbW